MRLRDKLKLLHIQNVWQSGDIKWETSLHKLTQPFGHVVLQGTWDIRSVISLLQQGQRPPNLARLVINYEKLPPTKLDNIWIGDHVRPHNKLKTLSQTQSTTTMPKTWQGFYMQWGAYLHKGSIRPFDHVVLQGYVTNQICCISTPTTTMVIKLEMLVP